MKPASKLAALVLVLLSVLHVLRLIFRFRIVIGPLEVPQGASKLGAVVPALLGLLVWRESLSHGDRP